MSSSARLSVMIAGGGTGGHLYPGIAVARELIRQRPDAAVVFAGTAQGVEARVIPREGFDLEPIRSAGLRGQSLRPLVRNVLLLPTSAWDAWRLVSRRSPDVVIGVGGYSSGPVVLVAALRGVPTLVLEQNAVPGLTNRLLAPFVRAVAVSFDATLPYFGRRGFVSGNPVRPEFFKTDDVTESGDPDTDTLRLLVVGGSQGARAINDAMIEAAPALAAVQPRLVITHQAGERDVEEVSEAYRRVGIEARVEAFLEPMAQEMQKAHIVVCRAGATTLAELAAVGRPSILAPLSTATDDHQRKNAEAVVRSGGADMVAPEELSGRALAGLVTSLATNPSRRAQMARTVRRLARPDAARLVVDRALQLAEA